MTTPKRPMLAASATDEEIREVLARKGELWVSPKIDGVRALTPGGVLKSETMGSIANAKLNILVEFAKAHLSDLDGVMVVGEPSSPSAREDTAAALRREAGDWPTRFFVFDNLEDPALPYRKRFAKVRFVWRRFEGLCGTPLTAHKLKCRPCRSWEEVEEATSRYVGELGYPGVILRDPGGSYKEGQTTVEEGLMLERRL